MVYACKGMLKEAQDDVCVGVLGWWFRFTTAPSHQMRNMEIALGHTLN